MCAVVVVVCLFVCLFVCFHLCVSLLDLFFMRYRKLGCFLRAVMLIVFLFFVVVFHESWAIWAVFT